MIHALATVLHRGRKAASNVMSACLASSRGSASPEHKHGLAHGNGQSPGRRPQTADGGRPGTQTRYDARRRICVRRNQRT